MNQLIIFNFKYKVEDKKLVNLSKSLKILDKTPNSRKYVDNIIGFSKNNGEFIQFLRLYEEDWEFDIPIQNLETKNWTGVTYSLQELPTNIVKKIVKAYFEEKDLIGLIREKFDAGEDPDHTNDNSFVIEKKIISWLYNNY